MKNIHFCFIAVILIMLFSCKSKKTHVDYAEPDLANIVKFKLIQINDVYEIAPISGGLHGGMARVAHIRDSIKEITPNTYMMLAGDFLNPSLLGSIEYKGRQIQGKQMIEVMNAMNFDLVTFGNHEFDLSEEDLLSRLEESNFAWTSANVEHITQDGDTLPFNYNFDGRKKPIPTQYIIDVPIDEQHTLPVGFFSVTINSTPKDYVHYKDYFESAYQAYHELENKAKIIIGLTHVSLEQDKKIAESMDKVPLIMGGHEHYNMLVSTRNGTIAKADANVKTIYVHTIQYDLETKQTNIHSTLIPINDKIAFQAKTQQVVDKWQQILESELKKFIDKPNEIIYSAKEPLDGTDEASRSKQTNLGKLITKAMSTSYKEVDAAIVNGGSIRIDDKLEGNVSSTDIFRVLPFGGTVIKVAMTGELLKETLEYAESKLGTGAYLQRDNIKFEKGRWYVNKQILQNNRIYQIAMTDFLITGYDIPFLTSKNKNIIEVHHPDEKEVASDIRKVIIAYLKKNHKLN